jgi:hypothetical protein
LRPAGSRAQAAIGHAIDLCEDAAVIGRPQDGAVGETGRTFERQTAGMHDRPAVRAVIHENEIHPAGGGGRLHMDLLPHGEPRRVGIGRSERVDEVRLFQPLGLLISRFPCSPQSIPKIPGAG